MTDHRETRRVQRQRERKALHIRETQAVAAYRRSGVAGAVAALGGGEVSDWPQDIERPLSGENTEVLE